MKLSQAVCFSCLAVLLAAAVGCGSPSGEVSGKVTLDGNPVVGAEVTFVAPADMLDRTDAIGYTQEDGSYRLVYPGDAKFNIPTGDYKVTIGGGDAADGMSDGPAVKVPSAYRGEDTLLSATIASGKNEIDFELSSNPESPAEGE